MDQISKIISLLNDNKNILLTGNAGTGKTTTLLELKKYLEKQHRHTVILAPTGLAAMLVEGLTIHSFFNVRFNFLGTKEGDIYWKNFFSKKISNTKQYHKKTTLSGVKGEEKEKQIVGIKQYYEEVYKFDDYQYKNTHMDHWCKVLTTLLKYDVIFIDEISMVHCDLFDIIMQMCFTLEPLLKQFHKSMPQFILCGDFYQLPPIDKTENNHEKCMCFSSKYWKKLNLENIVLNKIYRQKDNLFIKILQDIRHGIYSDKVKVFFAYLNKNRIRDVNEVDSDTVILHPLNKNCDQINQIMIDKIPHESRVFNAIILNNTKRIFQWEKITNARLTLELKVSQKVVVIKNKYSNNSLVYSNGEVGTIVELFDDGIVIKTTSGELLNIYYETWEIKEFDADKKKEVVVATLKQLPVISGYALTFHKSQGMTFDRICVAPLIFSGDSGNGMLYIALSRVKSIKDIFLLSPIKEDCLRKITAVENFLSETTTPSELTFEEEQELQQYS